MYNTPFNPYAQNVEIVKGYFKRTPVLLLAIFQFLGTLLSIGFCIYLTMFSSGLLQDLATQLPSDTSGISVSDWNSLMSTSLASSAASLIPTAIVSVLITVAYLLLFFKSRSQNPDSNPRAGATILFVLALIEMIGSIIAAVMMVIVFIVMVIAVGVGASYSSDSSFNAGPVIAIAGITVVFLIFILLFYSVNKMRYFKSVKNSCSSINLYADGAGAYGVMNVIFAVMSLLGMGVTAFLIPILDMSDELMAKSVGFSLNDYIDMDAMLILIIFGIAVMLVCLIYIILEAVVAFGYKKYINKIKYSYQPANVPEAPYQPAAVPVYTAPAAPVTYQPPVQPQAQQPEPAAPPKTEEQAPAFSAPSYCPSCGSPIEKDASFCTKCGYKLK